MGGGESRIINTLTDKKSQSTYLVIHLTTGGSGILKPQGPDWTQLFLLERPVFFIQISTHFSSDVVKETFVGKQSPTVGHFTKQKLS